MKTNAFLYLFTKSFLDTFFGEKRVTFVEPREETGTESYNRRAPDTNTAEGKKEEIEKDTQGAENTASAEPAAPLAENTELNEKIKTLVDATTEAEETKRIFNSILDETLEVQNNDRTEKVSLVELSADQITALTLYAVTQSKTELVDKLLEKLDGENLGISPEQLNESSILNISEFLASKKTQGEVVKFFKKIAVSTESTQNVLHLTTNLDSKSQTDLVILKSIAEAITDFSGINPETLQKYKTLLNTQKIQIPDSLTAALSSTPSAQPAGGPGDTAAPQPEATPPAGETAPAAPTENNLKLPTDREKAEFANLTSEQKLAKAFEGDNKFKLIPETNPKRIEFSIPPNSESLRSFKITKAFIAEIADQGTNTPEKARHRVLNRLLTIICKEGDNSDNSINTNKYKIKNYRESNAALAVEMGRLEAIIEAQYKPDTAGQIDTTEKLATLAIESGVKILTRATLGKDDNPVTYKATYNDNEPTKYSLTATLKANGTNDLTTIYNTISTAWAESEDQPFTEEEFIEANMKDGETTNGETIPEKDTVLILPFKDLYEAAKSAGKFTISEAGASSAETAGASPDKKPSATKPGEAGEGIPMEIKHPAPEETVAKMEAKPREKPEALKERQEKAKPTVEKAHEEFDTAMVEGRDAYAIIARLRELGTKLRIAAAKGELPKTIEFAKIPDTEKQRKTADGRPTTLPDLTWSYLTPSQTFQPTLGQTDKAIPETNNGFGRENMLVNQILALKRDKLKEDSPQYEKFLQLTLSKSADLFSDRQGEARLRRYEDKTLWKELSERAFTLDANNLKKPESEKTVAIGGLSEEKIAQYWDQFNGHDRVEHIMFNPPFSLNTLHVREIASRIISEDLNSRVYLEDIFKFMNGFPALKADKTVISDECLRDGGKFMARYKELFEKGAKVTNEEMKEVREMKKVLMACLELLEAIVLMKGPKTLDEKVLTPEEQINSGLEDESQKLVKKLQPLFNAQEKAAGAWDKFIGWATGAEGTSEKLTMSRADGTTYYVDEGMFRRHYNPHSALLALINTPPTEPAEGSSSIKMYTLDPYGKKILNKEAVIDEVNRILKRGQFQLLLQRQMQAKDRTFEEIQELEPKLKDHRYAIGTLDDIAELDGDQLLAFQLGFVNDKINQYEEKIQEAKDIMAEKETPPALKKILDELAKQGGLSEDQIQKIRSQMPLAMYFELHENPETGKLEGTGGAAYTIDIGNGQSVTIGLGGGRTGGEAAGAIGAGYKIAGEGGSLTLGAGLGGKGDKVIGTIGANFEIKLFKDGKNTVSLDIPIGLQGIGAGVSGSHEVASGMKVGWTVGVGFSWKNLASTAIGAGISFDAEEAWVNYQKESATEEVLESSGEGVKELWKKWNTVPKEKQWELIQRLPGFAKIQAEMDKVPDVLTKTTITAMVSSYVEQLEGNIYDKMHAYFLMPVGVSVGTAAIGLGAGLGPAGLALGVIGGIKFQIGSVTVFFPSPREESRLLSQISDTVMFEKVKQILEKLKKGEGKTVNFSFTEQTADTYYIPGKGMGIRREETKTDFSTLKGTGDITTEINTALEEAELKIEKTDTHTKLTIQNGDDKDVEVHIDPLAEKLGVISQTSDGSIYLVGDITDMIITRERFEFPAAVEDGSASIRDIITIQRASSVVGERDRTWIQDHEGYYLEKRMGQKEYMRQNGAMYISQQANLIEVDNYTGTEKPWTDTDVTLALDGNDKTNPATSPETGTIGRLRTFEADPEEVSKKLTEAGEKVERMHRALNEVTNKEYEDQLKDADKPAFEAKLSKFYDKMKKEVFELPESLTNPETLIAIIEKYNNSKKTNTTDKINIQDLKDKPKQYNYAISFLINKWFTTLPEGKGNKAIIERLKGVRAYTKKIYVELFKIKKERLRLQTTPEDMAEKMMKDIYDPLITALSKKGANFKDIIEMKGLDQGDILYSGSRTSDLKKALAITDSYEQTLKGTDKKGTPLPLDFGFMQLKGGPSIGKEYNLNSEDPIEKDIARALLEDASPLWEKGEAIGTKSDVVYFLTSSFATKALSLGALLFIIGEKNYNKLVEILQNKNNYFGKEDNPDTDTIAAVTAFHDYLAKLRESQLTGTKAIFKAVEPVPGTSESTITIDMSKPKIRSGAYTKCGNASFAVNEKGNVKIEGKAIPLQVAAKTQVTNDILYSRLDTATLNFTLFGGTSTTFAKEETPETPPPEGKTSKEGLPTKTPEGKMATEGISKKGDHTITPGQATTAPYQPEK